MTTPSYGSTTVSGRPRFLKHLQLALLLTCTVLGLGLALQHPLEPAAAVSLCLLWAMWVAWHQTAWLWVLPAALPVANLSPWTGWLLFDEFDLLVLATVSALLARQRFSRGEIPRLPALPTWQVALVIALLAWWVCSTALGLLAAPSSPWHLFANHESNLWPVRAGKALLWALLLWPWLRLNLLQTPRATLNRIAVGMLLGLAAVSLVALNERLAYPGLIDFVSHYRITALFWEMHVGGAAIDAYLALAGPFVIWALWRYRGWKWLIASLLAVCVTYAALTTFARGVYLATVVGLIVWLLARYAQLLAQGKPSKGMRWLAGLCWALLTLSAGTGLLLLMFEYAGIWGALACTMVLSTLAAWLKMRTPQQGWKLPASLVLGAVLLIEVVAVLGGDSFMNQRLEEGPADLDSRIGHWRHGVGLLQTPTGWLLGLGAGRFPAAYAASDPSRDFAGRWSWKPEPASPHAVLEGPRHREDLGGYFSATQRVPLLSHGSYSLRLRAKTSQAIQLLARVCEKHLLYDGRCQSAVFTIPANTGGWTEINRRLVGKRLDSGVWWAPRTAVFSLSVLTTSGVASLSHVELFGPQGQPLLKNGDFADGLAHWFPRAQRFYLPWHTDNLALELLIERGVLGLLVFGLLVAAALRGLVRALALPDEQGGGLVPVLWASVASVLAVGLVSSVLDVPRIAFLLFFLLLLGLTLAEKSTASDRKANAVRPGQKVPPAL